MPNHVIHSFSKSAKLSRASLHFSVPYRQQDCNYTKKYEIHHLVPANLKGPSFVIFLFNREITGWWW